MALVISLILAQADAIDSFPGALTLINLGVLGICFILFSLGKIHPESTVKDLRTQLAEEKKSRQEESSDAKAVRDAVIKDVVPVMALMGERSKDNADLSERLLAIVLRLEGK